jgi:hypothetical protein
MAPRHHGHHAALRLVRRPLLLGVWKGLPCPARYRSFSGRRGARDAAAYVARNPQFAPNITSRRLRESNIAANFGRRLRLNISTGTTPERVHEPAR